MTLAKTPYQEAWDDFNGTLCSVCKHTKKRFDSFCSSCYFKLDTAMRQALYKRFGSGYEDSYHEAKDFLLEELKAKE